MISAAVVTVVLHDIKVYTVVFFANGNSMVDPNHRGIPRTFPNGNNALDWSSSTALKFQFSNIPISLGSFLKMITAVLGIFKSFGEQRHRR